MLRSRKSGHSDQQDPINEVVLEGVATDKLAETEHERHLQKLEEAGSSSGDHSCEDSPREDENEEHNMLSKVIQKAKKLIVAVTGVYKTRIKIMFAENTLDKIQEPLTKLAKDDFQLDKLSKEFDREAIKGIVRDLQEEIIQIKTYLETHEDFLLKGTEHELHCFSIKLSYESTCDALGDFDKEAEQLVSSFN